jgi:hypothetical protein
MGQKKRVKQATERALTIFTETFQDLNNEIFVLIFEYDGENCFGASYDYLHQQFPSESFANFYNQLELVDSGAFSIDENGNKVFKLFEKKEERIIIGKLPVKDINFKNILNAIANTEMGFEPGIDQTVYFFDPLNDTVFNMYDDRGCLVESDKANKIRHLYIKRNDWIVDYHRPEIDEYFK